ncbi:MAG: RNase adapter RapZ [Propionibacteriaceae bacterium]|jgi:UPF0042 nucleotide-binding protein|nr:RNase adapter RapZ [Propionibacteriaceae bacterium]
MAADGRIEVVIITGLSGAGRRTAAHTLEDLGWYVVDNLPADLLPRLAQRLRLDQVDRLAVVLDVRSRSDLERLPDVLEDLGPVAEPPRIVYLEASDAVIVRRQESNRRPVPLQGSGTTLDGIRNERWMLSTLRAAADMVVDTTDLTIYQLQDRLRAAFAGPGSGLKVTLVSFGYKHGLPLDADLVLDMRFLPNPHWVPELRPQTGLSQAVSQYVLGQPAAQRFLDDFDAWFATVLAGYASEGKHLVELAIGCTGGKHRSVAMAVQLGQRLSRAGVETVVLHRDLGSE